MTANEFVRWLEKHKVGATGEGLQGIYVIWQGAIQALIEQCGEYWESEDKTTKG